MPPKAEATVLEGVPGLPPGWRAVQRNYISGPTAGRVYVRFSNEKHKKVTSIRKAIELDAEDKGYDVVAALQKYDAIKASRLADRNAVFAAMREERQLVEEDRKKRCIDEFRNRYGKLDGATVGQLEGWRRESKYEKGQGQVNSRYISPEGTSYFHIHKVEALFGSMILNGDAVPDIEAARARVDLDENGRVVNVAEAAPGVKRRKAGMVRVAKEEDYRASKDVNLVIVPTATAELDRQLVPEPARVEADAADIHALLLARGYPSDTRMFYFTGSSGRNCINKKLVDAVNGFYFSHPFLYDGRPCYQQVSLMASRDSLVCRGFYVSWSSVLQVWKVGKLDTRRAGLAICRQDVYSPLDLEEPWMLYEPNAVEREDSDSDGVATPADLKAPAEKEG